MRWRRYDRFHLNSISHQLSRIIKLMYALHLYGPDCGSLDTAIQLELACQTLDIQTAPVRHAAVAMNLDSKVVILFNIT